MTKRSTLGWYMAALAALPLLVLAGGDNPLFPQPGMLDSWFYLGFFRDLAAFKRSLYPGTYYGSRLSWLLPGAAVHSVLDAMAAAVVLHLAVYYTAVFSVFFTVDAAAGRRRAFLAAMLLGLHPWLWRAIGTDYVDGVGLAWCALSMALASRAACRPDRRALLAASGAAAACAVWTNLVWAPMVLLMPLHLVVGNGSGGTRADRGGRPTFLWMGVGAVLLTAALCLANYRLDGHFDFFTPSLDFVLQRRGGNPSRQPIWFASGLALWLWHPLLAAVAALIALTARMRKARVLAIQGLWAMAVLGWLQWTDNGSLGLPFYASYLLPFTFAIFGVTFFAAADRLSAPVFAALCGGVAAVYAVAWWDAAGTVIPAWPAGAVLAVAAVVVLAASLLWQGRVPAVVGATAAIAVLAVVARERGLSDPHAYRNEYREVTRTFDHIRQLRQGRPALFWLGTYTPLAGAYMWEYALLGRSFPEGGCSSEMPPPGSLVVVASKLPDMREIAQAKLGACWADSGLRPELLPWDTVAIFRVAPDKARWHPLGMRDGRLTEATAEEPLPLARWAPTQLQNLAERAAVRQTADGLVVRTSPGAFQYSLRYPTLTVPLAGRCRFAVRYWPGDGIFAFGAVRRSDETWQKVTLAERGNGDTREKAFTMDLRAGETVDLQIANHREGGGASTFILRELTAVVVTK